MPDADRDILLAPLTDAAALVALRRAWPGLAILAIVPDAATEIALLDAGADDAVRADAGEALIAARAVALRRRLGPTRLAIGDVSIDLVARSVWRGGRRLPLLAREYALLLHFVRHPGALVTRGELREAVWGMDFDPGTNVIEVHMSRLRAKLDRGFAVPLLLTEKGRGYRFVADPAIAAVDQAG